MEQVIIQECGCIALPESVADALGLRRGMMLDVSFTPDGDAVILRPRPTDDPADQAHAAEAPHCLRLPPLR